MLSKDVKFAFWGTDEFSVKFLETLKKKGVSPNLIITLPDKPKGRKLILTPPPAKIWSEENEISFLQSEKLDDNLTSELKKQNFEIFVVASYGKIIPKNILDIPRFGSLNIHPSLLPKLRGPSPLQETILREEEPGVTIIKMDEKMDHGPIIAQKKLQRKESKDSSPEIYGFIELRDLLAKLGADILIEALPRWIGKEIEEKPQDESLATYTKLIDKEDGLIDLEGDLWENYKKIMAYEVWPQAYFFKEKNDKKTRVKITKAVFKENILKIEKVIPEGKNEMDYDSFIRSFS